MIQGFVNVEGGGGGGSGNKRKQLHINFRSPEVDSSESH